MRIPEYFLTPFSFWGHPSCHNVLNHFILFGGASWVSWVLYGIIMGIMDRPQVVHRKHPLAPNDHDLLGYRSIRSIHGMEKVPPQSSLQSRFRLDFGRENLRAFSLARRTHLWSFRVQRFRVFRTWILLGMAGLTRIEGFFEYFFVPKGRDRNSGAKPSSETVALVFSMCLMCFFLYSLSECIVWLCHRTGCCTLCFTVLG
jgi:hypothetical protein